MPGFVGIFNDFLGVAVGLLEDQYRFIFASLVFSAVMGTCFRIDWTNVLRIFPISILKLIYDFYLLCILQY